MEVPATLFIITAPRQNLRTTVPLLFRGAAEQMTTSMKEKRWVETPKFILRASCLRTITQGWPPGRFLEVGAGTGQMTKLFLDLGFQGVCHDPGPQNREVLRGNLASHRVGVRGVEDFNTISQGSFQYLFAFEVLEHIDPAFSI